MGKKLSKSIKVGVPLVAVLFLIIWAALWIPFYVCMGFPPLNLKISNIGEIQKMENDFVKEIRTAWYMGYEKFLWWGYPQDIEFWNPVDNPE
ncbi:MAG: hypothetical protein KAV87_14160, partial [Desulfobacteraceae bacterium]|nr:hypothetical protein [Desulfobacteraceae bacterium]